MTTTDAEATAAGAPDMARATLDRVRALGTPLQRVRALYEVIVDGGNRAQQLRRVPSDTIDALVAAGMFRFTIPGDLGGEDATIAETIEVIEAISAIDGSVGWNVMLGSEINAMAAGGMNPEIAQRVYVDNPAVIMCGGGGPGTKPARAVAQADGSYRVWAQGTFISGCHNAEWCFMPAPIYDGDELRRDEAGQPIARMWFLHRREWEIVDTWDVAGLRGSGSHDVRAEGALVPAELAEVQLMTLPARYDNPVYRVPVPLRLAYNKAAVALGVARGALDAFAGLAATKVPLQTNALLRDRPIAQQRFGEAEATVRAARAFLFEAMGSVDAELRAGREAPSARATQLARLACTHVANSCMTAVDLIHNAGGTSAMYMDNPLERRLRDAHGCATHRWVANPIYGELGKIFLGHEPPAEFAG